MAKRKKVVEEPFINPEVTEEPIVTEESKEEVATEESTEETNLDNAIEEELRKMLNHLDTLKDERERAEQINSIFLKIDELSSEVLAYAIIMNLIKNHYTDDERKELEYMKWLEYFKSPDFPEDEKASERFRMLSSKMKVSTNESGNEIYQFARKGFEKVTPKALDKTFEKNVFKAQVFFQNLRDEINMESYKLKESKLLEIQNPTDEEGKQLVKVQNDIEELTKNSGKYQELFGTPDFSDVTEDMLAFITAWCINPEKGRQYTDKETKTTTYDIYFEGQEKVRANLITYNKKYLDKPETDDKQIFSREVKDCLEKACNGWKVIKKNENGEEIVVREVKRMAKKNDVGYKNIHVKFNNEMLKNCASFVYNGRSNSTREETWKDSYTVMREVFRNALAYTFGIFDKETCSSGGKYTV